jgi:hypothetical protein
MINVLNDDLIDLRQACREKPFRNPRTGKPCHIASMYRHVLRGARAANGERIRLETVRTPRGLMTTREAIVAFIGKLTNPDEPPAPRKASRERDISRAESELVGAGLM